MRIHIFLCFFLLLNHSDWAFSSSEGVMIAGIGIAGTGKSTTFIELNRLLKDSVLFLEPEEEKWPEVVQMKKEAGQFSLITAYRNLRMPNYLRAQALRKEGKFVLIDSYFDLVTPFILGHEGGEWIIEKEDPYFNALNAMAQVDLERLPLPDILVVFHCNRNHWEEMIRGRGRKSDQNRNLDATYALLPFFEDAANFFAKERKVKILHLEVDFGSPQKTAEKLRDLLAGNL